MLIRRVVVCVLVAVSVIAIAPVSDSHHYVAIQPGVESPGVRIPMQGDPGEFSCTYNFIFRDKKNVRYIGIAGHCVTGVGQVMHAGDVGRIGTVVWKAPLPEGRACGDPGPRPEGAEPCVDFALVRIDRELYSRIDPSVRHWGGPTGFVPAEEIEAGTQLYHYGYGTGPHAHEATRPRTGVVLGAVAGGCGYQAAFPFSAGDSGSPQITADGRALGLMTTAEGDGALGFAIDCVLDAAAKAGLRLKLETAPLNDEVEREDDRLGHIVGPNRLLPQERGATPKPVRSGTIIGGVFTTGPSGDCSWQPDCLAWLESDCDPALAGRDPAVLASIVDVSDLAKSGKRRVFEFKEGEPAGFVPGGVAVQFWTKGCNHLYGWYSTDRVTWHNSRTKVFKIPTSAKWMTVAANDNLNLVWTLR